MALLEALLLDPFRINVWIAVRNDRVAGTGTHNDPYDGSTQAKFDALMSTMPSNTCVLVPFREVGAGGQDDCLWLLVTAAVTLC
jgi:hypothetical protein